MLKSLRTIVNRKVIYCYNVKSQNLFQNDVIMTTQADEDNYSPEEP